MFCAVSGHRRTESGILLAAHISRLGLLRWRRQSWTDSSTAAALVDRNMRRYCSFSLHCALDDFASSQRMGDIVYNKNWDVREHPRTKRMKICDFFQETQSSVNVVDSCCLHTKPRENWNDNKTKVSIWSVFLLVLTHHRYAFVVAGPSHLLF